MSWDTPKRNTNNSLPVPKNLDAIEFVEFIIRDIIQEPSLLKTAPVKQIIKHFTNGYFADRGSVRTMNREMVVKNLEEFMNGKSIYESLRENPTKLFQEPYLNVETR